MQVFFRNCTHILRRTQEKKFEDMFLVKIASKGTSLISVSYKLQRFVVDLVGYNLWLSGTVLDYRSKGEIERWWSFKEP